ncbi:MULTISPECIES: GNAT family N-acetyltransferase [unclassified Roseitalea]|uniref:GNAT family N-acetyltransferase n=1 Tax=unclassified Roseitalea TaxID=2639107 RepID=UPI00273DA48B|nr:MULTISPECIES: GNAT family N-acetyltransferase [unclassified Roseitalea]
MRQAVSDLVVRPFRQADGETMAVVHRRAILATSDRFYSESQRRNWAAGLIADSYRRLADDGEWFEVACIGERLIGFCGRVDDAIRGLYVEPAWQRRGVGRLLAERAEAAIRERGHTHTAIRSSLPAVDFYRALGYRDGETRVHQTRGGEPMAVLVMHKQLAPATEPGDRIR